MTPLIIGVIIKFSNYYFQNPNPTVAGALRSTLKLFISAKPGPGVSTEIYRYFPGVDYRISVSVEWYRSTTIQNRIAIKLVIWCNGRVPRARSFLHRIKETAVILFSEEINEINLRKFNVMQIEITIYYMQRSTRKYYLLAIKLYY